MDPTKLAVGAGTAVLIAGGGYGVSTLFDGSMPNYFSLPDQANKYITDYHDYFVDHSKPGNDAWWRWVYKNRYQVALGSNNKPFAGFANLKSGDGKDNSIKKVCEKVYEVAKDNSTNTIKPSGASQNTEYLEADVWRYCTAVEVKPKLVSEVTNESSSYTTDNAHGGQLKDKLVSVLAEENSYFWAEQERRFFRDQKDDSRSGGHATTADSSIFKALFDKRNKRRSKNETLKNVCKDAYNKSESTTPKVSKEHVLKFCSLKGKE
ncbi:hypothetical protein MHSWG343_08150 [Candidatus Mycoplasma haematohominis]|uniref:Uncharacterized protein n=1 Tax=Candidatus Mycoplasma haematohominis TaxID=1494318 RepID=A0A478FQH5_9MOLU|nr:hypothetical protein MHSWG343_08150 [Candidatus Mycoplasma haemohominis]